MSQMSTGSKMGLQSETANFIALQKRYIKAFLTAYYRFNDQISLIPGAGAEDGKAPGSKGGQSVWSFRNTAMYLVDSDFDTEDEAYADDIEEVISNHIVNSVTSEGGGAADLDEDFLAYEENVKIKPVDQKAENKVPPDAETKPASLPEENGAAATPSAQALKNKKKKQKRKAKKDKVAAAKVENTPETNNEPTPNDNGAKN